MNNLKLIQDKIIREFHIPAPIFICKGVDSEIFGYVGQERDGSKTYYKISIFNQCSEGDKKKQMDSFCRCFVNLLGTGMGPNGVAVWGGYFINPKINLSNKQLEEIRKIYAKNSNP